jgi:hypothetical protein
MSWIESHEEVGDHHKTHKLAKLLNCSVPTAVGHLHLLWHYTLKVAWRDGDLSKQSPTAIARGCWWDGDPDALLSALCNSGNLDGMNVHDWKDYAKFIIYQRLYNETRRKNRTPFPVDDSCKKSVVTSASTTATLPDLTLPNHTTLVRTTSASYPSNGDSKIPIKGWFDSLWASYPPKGRVGKKNALRHFVSSVHNVDDANKCARALENYMSSKRVKEGYVQNASTWFNNWDDWAEYVEKDVRKDYL